MTTALVLAGLLLGAARRLPAPPLRAPQRPSDPLLLPRLLSVALSAGLPLGAALTEAARLVPDPAGAEADRILRAARRSGLVAALIEHEDLLGGLPRHLARAHLTGTTMRDAVRTHVREESDRIRAASLTRARTLPTKLLVPLALLLLPGFVAIVVVPPLLEETSALLGPLLGP